MKTCKQTASMGAAATDEAHSKSAAKSDAIQSRKGKKAKGKLAVKSNGAEKPKTHDLSDVTRGLAVMSIVEEMSEDELLALYCYRNIFWMNNFPGVYDEPSVHAEKAPYLAKARVNKILLAEAHAFKKTLRLTYALTNKMVNLKV
ncbi:uncharacterized protein [Lolium perenne]|uniref:uncharacterized protein isoform X2 n=1 Tax=Lolium perenne TaxID=4522 RepID=UPI0021F62AC7|nr:uncharacterized protein LOC127299160 isoform X2 [Lolium perenne]